MIGRAGIQFLVTIPAAVLGITGTQVVVHKVAAVSVHTRVRAALVDVLVTVRSWRENVIKL